MDIKAVIHGLPVDDVLMDQSTLVERPLTSVQLQFLQTMHRLVGSLPHTAWSISGGLVMLYDWQRFAASLLFKYEGAPVESLYAVLSGFGFKADSNGESVFLSHRYFDEHRPHLLEQITLRGDAAAWRIYNDFFSYAHRFHSADDGTGLKEVVDIDSDDDIDYAGQVTSLGNDQHVITNLSDLTRLATTIMSPATEMSAYMTAPGYTRAGVNSGLISGGPIHMDLRTSLASGDRGQPTPSLAAPYGVVSAAHGISSSAQTMRFSSALAATSVPNNPMTISAPRFQTTTCSSLSAQQYLNPPPAAFPSKSTIIYDMPDPPPPSVATRPLGASATPSMNLSALMDAVATSVPHVSPKRSAPEPVPFLAVCPPQHPNAALRKNGTNNDSNDSPRLAVSLPTSAPRVTTSIVSAPMPGSRPRIVFPTTAAPAVIAPVSSAVPPLAASGSPRQPFRPPWKKSSVTSFPTRPGTLPARSNTSDGTTTMAPRPAPTVVSQSPPPASSDHPTMAAPAPTLLSPPVSQQLARPAQLSLLADTVSAVRQAMPTIPKPASAPFLPRVTVNVVPTMTLREPLPGSARSVADDMPQWPGAPCEEGPEIDFEQPYGRRRGRRGTFPLRVYNMVGAHDTISWSPDGTQVRITDRKRFLSEALPTFGMKYDLASFVFRLRFYNFTVECPKNKDHVIASHPLFHRDMPKLVDKLIEAPRVQLPREAVIELTSIYESNPYPELATIRHLRDKYGVDEQAGRRCDVAYWFAVKRAKDRRKGRFSMPLDLTAAEHEGQEAASPRASGYSSSDDGDQEPRVEDHDYVNHDEHFDTGSRKRGLDDDSNVDPDEVVDGFMMDNGGEIDGSEGDLTRSPPAKRAKLDDTRGLNVTTG